VIGARKLRELCAYTVGAKMRPLSVIPLATVLLAAAACEEEKLTCPDPIETTVSIAPTTTGVVIDPALPDAEVTVELGGTLVYDCADLHDELEVASAGIYESDAESYTAVLVAELDIRFSDGTVEAGKGTCDEDFGNGYQSVDVTLQGLTNGVLAPHCGKTLWIETIIGRAGCASGGRRETGAQLFIGCP
jgi:hypothetical protein